MKRGWLYHDVINRGYRVENISSHFVSLSWPDTESLRIFLSTLLYDWLHLVGPGADRDSELRRWVPLMPFRRWSYVTHTLYSYTKCRIGRRPCVT